MLKKFVLTFFLSSLSLYGAEHVKVDVSSKVEKNQATVKFKVASNGPLKLNFSAPWHLKFTDTTVFEKADYSAANFSKELPGFVLVSKQVSKTSSIPYELTAYSCTSDASQCFRDVLKGEVQIKANDNKK